MVAKLAEQDLSSAFNASRRWAQDYPQRLLEALVWIEFNATRFVEPFSVNAF